jgi:hypothetical protein
MLKKEYRVYLQYRAYLLGLIAEATGEVVRPRYQEGRINALQVALEEHDRLFRSGQPA